MMLHVFIASIVLLVFAGFGFGIKLLFDKNAKLPASSCQAANSSDKQISCGCGGGHCSSTQS